MMSSAPRARSRAAFSAELVAAITVAPYSLPSCTKHTPTPPEAPRISIFSPAAICPFVTSMRRAVP
jgi:hypothetical protein